MGEEVGAQPKATEFDPVIENILKKFRDLLKADAEALPNAGQSSWLMPPPEKWEGDLSDFEGISSMFERLRANEQFQKAVEKAEAPGVTGDMVVTTLQIAYMQAIERAFRCRHTMSRTRAVMQLSARKAGHGNNQGALSQAMAYVRNLMAEASTQE
jgi:hypothetical protein